MSDNILKDVHDLLSDSTQWTKYREAAEENDNEVCGDDPNAVCWCLFGALQRFDPTDNGSSKKAAKDLADVIRKDFATQVGNACIDKARDVSVITHFNDEIATHETLLKVIEKAIQHQVERQCSVKRVRVKPEGLKHINESGHIDKPFEAIEGVVCEAPFFGPHNQHVMLEFPLFWFHENEVEIVEDIDPTKKPNADTKDKTMNNKDDSIIFSRWYYVRNETHVVGPEIDDVTRVQNPETDIDMGLFREDAAKLNTKEEILSAYYSMKDQNHENIRVHCFTAFDDGTFHDGSVDIEISVKRR